MRTITTIQCFLVCLIKVCQKLAWLAPLLNKTYKFYTSYADAKSATQALGIKSSVEYKKRFKEDFQLPSQPDNVYEEDWINWGF